MTRYAVLVGLASIAARAQPPQVFQTETKVVLVDAVVTDKKGEYVRGLTAKDFRVWEDGKEQAIRSFSVESGSSAGPSSDVPRRLVLFFDNNNMNTADQSRVRQAAASFIDANAAPNQLMAVVDFDEGFRVVQSFTENAGRLKDAVRGVRVTAAISGGPAPRETAMGIAGANARDLVQALGSLARNLNAAPGRKIVVLFTGSASAAAAQQADVANLVQISNRSNVAIYPFMQGGLGMPMPGPSNCEGPQLGVEDRALPRNAARNTAALPGCQPDDSIPFTIAKGTGGFVASPSNDLLAQLRKIVAEQSQSYVLGYTPPDSPPGSYKDGACHTLRVKVDRGGAEVRARSSYCAAKPQELLAKSRVEQALEKRAADEAGGAVASIQAPFFYLARNVAQVHVAMEIAVDALKFENQKGKLHAEMNLLGIAAEPDGGVAARFSDIVKRDFDSKEDLDNWLDRGRTKSLHYEKEFKIIPGQYNLTVVFSSGGANFGKVETPLIVPAYDGSRIAVSGLALGREVRPASDLGLEASLIDEGTPLIAGGAQLIPAGTNAFGRSEPAFCYFEVYSPGPPSGQVAIRLRIVDRESGAEKWDGGDAKIQPVSGKSAIPVGLSLPLASLTPGSYRLEVTATGETDDTAKRTVDFVLTPQ